MINSIYENSTKVLTTEQLSELQSEFRDLVNQKSIDNDMNVPDLVLAKYLVDCLLALAQATEIRDRFLDIDPRSIIGSDNE